MPFSSSKETKRGCLGYIYILPNLVGIIINHYKDPYSTTSSMESNRVFFVAQVKHVKLWEGDCPRQLEVHQLCATLWPNTWNEAGDWCAFSLTLMIFVWGWYYIGAVFFFFWGGGEVVYKFGGPEKLVEVFFLNLAMK